MGGVDGESYTGVDYRMSVLSLRSVLTGVERRWYVSLDTYRHR